MSDVKINICALGDPKDPGTWSGTPYNLYRELDRMDALGTAFDSYIPFNRRRDSWINKLGKLYYGSENHLYRGAFQRYARAAKIRFATAASGTNLTLHTGSLDLPFLLPPRNQKHFLYCDSTWHLWSSYARNFDGFSRRLLRDAEILERKTYAQMTHIFPIAEYVREDLISHYGISPDKITVVGTGLGVIQPYHGPKDYTNGKIVFAAKGRFEDKGGHLALAAFERAVKVKPELEMIVVGKNDYSDKIDHPGIRTYGYLPVDELQKIFNKGSLFLMPAISEAWGLVYLEALACRMPIVGLNRKSFPEISGYGKYGFGLDEPDPVQLGDLLVEAFNRPDQLAAMGDSGQKYCAERFTWKQVVRRIIEAVLD